MITQNALNFYEKNKHLSWSLPELPRNCNTSLEIADFILNKSDFGWLELDIKIDVDAWKKEVPTSGYVDHRGVEHPGWNSCCIHGIDVDKTGAWTNYGYTREEDVPYNWTSISKHTPNIKNFWENVFPSDRYRRIRFMQLESQGCIDPHSDMPGRLPGENNFDALEFGVPVNIAVVHPDNCFMTLEGYGTVPFEEGKAFIINIRNYHSVINFSDTDRIHVIGHSYGYGSRKQDFADLVARSYFKMKSRN
jgi:hypothetical protein